MGKTSVHPTRRKWQVLYAITALVCAVLALTAGSDSDSKAWHAGAIIVIAGSLILWRLFEP
jgi:hypothetical protein